MSTDPQVAELEISGLKSAYHDAITQMCKVALGGDLSDPLLPSDDSTSMTRFEKGLADVRATYIKLEAVLTEKHDKAKPPRA
jgi:hypothetical protein